MAKVPIDTLPGVDLDEVQKVGIVLTTIVDAMDLPCSRDGFFVALLMVAKLYSRESSFSEARIAELTKLAEACADQAGDQWHDGLS